MKSNLKQRHQQLSKQNKNTLFIIPSGRAPQRSHSVHYPFKVSSDFYYLTGLSLENAFFVLFEGRAQLFVLAATEQQKIWQEFEDLQSQIEDFNGYKKIIELVEGDLTEHFVRMEALIQKAQVVAFPRGRSEVLENFLSNKFSYNRKNSIFFGRDQFPAWQDSQLLIGQVRSQKDDDEIACLDEAVRRTLAVHGEFAKLNFVGQTEKQVRDHFELEFLKRGMGWTSYQTIVGAGQRACGLHARPGYSKLKSEDLVLIDAGAEFESYCADITRTWSIGGVATEEQHLILDLVTEVQRQTIESICVGDRFDKIDSMAKELLKEKLSHRLGVSVTSEEIQQLMPHRTSHWLGLDVHDPCPYFDHDGQSVQLQKGMVMTIEPGLYFRPGLSQKWKKFEGLGVRIEDDVVMGGKKLLVLGQEEKIDLN